MYGTSGFVVPSMSKLLNIVTSAVSYIVASYVREGSQLLGLNLYCLDFQLV